MKCERGEKVICEVICDVSITNRKTEDSGGRDGDDGEVIFDIEKGDGGGGNNDDGEVIFDICGQGAYSSENKCSDNCNNKCSENNVDNELCLSPKL
jgi:hypothetical protein